MEDEVKIPYPGNAEELLVDIDRIIRQYAGGAAGDIPSMERLLSNYDKFAETLAKVVMGVVREQLHVSTIRTDENYQKGCGFPKFSGHPGLSHFLCAFRE